MAKEQYGVIDVACPGNASKLDSSLRPVMFWWVIFNVYKKHVFLVNFQRFFHIRDEDNTPEAQIVFCAPTLQVSIVQAITNLNNGSLTNVTATGNFSVQINNVTGIGGMLNGSAFNGQVIHFIEFPNQSLMLGQNCVAG
jgi:hypothetical protein